MKIRPENGRKTLVPGGGHEPRSRFLLPLTKLAKDKAVQNLPISFDMHLTKEESNPSVFGRHQGADIQDIKDMMTKSCRISAY
jgi:hypothetical protein